MKLHHWVSLLLLLPGCAGESAGPLATLADLPPLQAAITTWERTLTPMRMRMAPTGTNPALPDGLLAYRDGGYGDLREGPGEQPFVSRTLDGSPPPPLGPGAKLLTRFVHMADLQLADDESPTRVGILDGIGETEAALRPQDAYLCRLANAAVRTINGIHRKRPVSFVLLGGDNADSAQGNELDWVLGILEGQREVHCDSGQDDDPVPGPDNDGKDPFVAEGLLMPWRWVTGNHDVLVQGNLVVDDARRAEAAGDDSTLGTRDYTEGGAIAVGEFVVPDARRVPLRRGEIMERVGGSGDGHGIGEAQRRAGKAFYSFDVEGTPLRFVILDTGAETGGSDGMLHQADVDAFVRPALDEAKRLGKWVVLASHHAASQLTKDGGPLGAPQADAILPADWKRFLGQYDNVLFSMVGHEHVHRARAVRPDVGHAYWEVLTAAIADNPHQFRVVELWDGDNGYALLRATCVDLDVSGDGVAAEGRRRGLIDFTSGWHTDDGAGVREDRNIELWIPKPAALK